MATILVVDDEEKIRQLIRKYAMHEGHTVLEAADGLAALDVLAGQDVDLVILDVMMPKQDGFTSLRDIREESRVPVLMLSARGEEYDRIHGFQAGADDYVVKPFSPRELMLRIAAVLARVQGAADGGHDVYETERLRVDFTARDVRVDGRAVALSPREYDLLFYLVKNCNIALTRDQILTKVWGYDFEGDDRTLDTHIKTLRRALGEQSEHIVTLRGVGYRFDG